LTTKRNQDKQRRSAEIRSLKIQNKNIEGEG